MRIPLESQMMSIISSCSLRFDNINSFLFGDVSLSREKGSLCSVSVRMFSGLFNQTTRQENYCSQIILFSKFGEEQKNFPSSRL